MCPPCALRRVLPSPFFTVTTCNTLIPSEPRKNSKTPSLQRERTGVG
ncbi:hypothetical protein CSUI_008424 [Cystoisospora suis]|uniref:Uncharacterized protein n=1 Tax=Cystoisospora suis TaxID=483139 RepID=A0A2C6KMP6_9APIC|nr:hypothetical protein CSUI_008424 [Cystoisospora suis]